jgi:hypothetical protein
MGISIGDHIEWKGQRYFVRGFTFAKGKEGAGPLGPLPFLGATVSHLNCKGPDGKEVNVPFKEARKT